MMTVLWRSTTVSCLLSWTLLLRRAHGPRAHWKHEGRFGPTCLVRSPQSDLHQVFWQIHPGAATDRHKCSITSYGSFGVHTDFCFFLDGGLVNHCVSMN